jgi:CheY-like chemotaxis protein
MGLAVGHVKTINQILLAEDNPGDVELVREALREHDVHCELRIISDGEQALTFIDGLDLDSDLPCPDLLLLDLHLPKCGGIEILQRLRASERCGQTPVVVFTSSESMPGPQNAGETAAVHYFRKPASLSQFMQLGQIVKEIVNRPQLS